MTRAGTIVDTSVAIDPEGVEPESPVAISVVTLGELHAGVKLARDAAASGLRSATLAAVRNTFATIPVDERIAEAYGDLLALARRERRTTKATDLLIVATALATGRALVTRDERQARLAEAASVATA